MASRRQLVIDQHVRWIHENCLDGNTGRVLDLACGPGFYLQRLARLGHACVGFDFSSASIAYAQSQADEAGLAIDYTCSDIRAVDYGDGFDLAMLIFGEFNVFTVDDAQQLLSAMCRALKPGGCILLEPYTRDAVKEDGKRPPSWHTEESGPFSPRPHLWLAEHFWHVEYQAATTRYFIIDAATGAVDRYAATSQGYSDEEYDRLLRGAGFSKIRRWASLAGSAGHKQKELFVLMAKKA